MTAEAARLLRHCGTKTLPASSPRFCQIEAVETAIWLTEVAPHAGKNGQRFIEHFANANAEANPGLLRVVLKLATAQARPRQRRC